MLWFTSDTHFGHENILKCGRPFSSVKEMDEELIRRWNSTVSPNDEVWHLGDFAWRTPQKYIEQLQGQLHLVIGNHDHKDTRKLPRWLSVQPLVELKDGNASLIVLCHYVMLTWNNSHFGTWHLHGHSHGSLQAGIARRLDVGVDCNAFAPIGYEEVRNRLSGIAVPAIDHHRPSSDLEKQGASPCSLPQK